LGANKVQAYDYPIDNPYAATIIGTPEAFQADLPKPKIEEMSLNLFPNRKVSDVFWYNKKAKVGYALQEKKTAPLMFIISGTGGGHSSPSTAKLQKVMYGAGYHVVSLPSPTHPNFIISASNSQVPGYSENDTKCLYELMKAVRDRLGEKIETKEFYLSGFSLGAFNAGFVAKLDNQEKAFNFKKILMFNPPVSLYNSSIKLDKMLEENVPGGLNNINAYFESVMKEFSKIYGYVPANASFGGDFLYKIYKDKKPTNKQMKSLIGLAFRLSLADMAFTSDVSTKAGYVVPKELDLGVTDSTTDYLKVLFRLSFDDYFEGIFIPYYSKKAKKTKSQLLADESLHKIVKTLALDKVHVFHNNDDIILNKGDIAFFKNTFENRAHIYPHGGHGGNLNCKENVKDVYAVLEVLK
jgi:predicted alpha/beta-fold hydrolase